MSTMVTVPSPLTSQFSRITETSDGEVTVTVPFRALSSVVMIPAQAAFSRVAVMLPEAPSFTGTETEARSVFSCEV